MATSAMTRNLDHHLQLHGNQFRVRLEIPATLRPQFKGQRFLIKSLGAVTRRQARLLRGPVLSEFELEVARARNADDPILQQARMIRRQWQRPGLSDADMERTFIDAMELADDVEARSGQESGNTAFNIATGTIAPLGEYLEEWIADQRFTGKTALLHRKAFSVLAQWCKARGIATTLQAIAKRVAWDFIEIELKPGRAPKTINRYLSTYRTHWRWLEKRARVGSNPWRDTHVAEQRKAHEDDEESKVAFTDEQVATLLGGNAPGLLLDLMLIAALTGARINAICELKVRHCTNGTLHFKRAKREPKDRTIPVHSRLQAVIKRRTEGKAPDGYLFHELPDATATRPRSASASQAFTRYRRKMKVGGDEGEHSPYDFHSFRRWFTTKAEQADQPPHVIDFVTGHKRPGETLGRYSRGPSMAQMKKCVEAVRLP